MAMLNRYRSINCSSPIKLNLITTNNCWTSIILLLLWHCVVFCFCSPLIITSCERLNHLVEECHVNLSSHSSSSNASIISGTFSSQKHANGSYYLPETKQRWTFTLPSQSVLTVQFTGTFDIEAGEFGICFDELRINSYFFRNFPSSETMPSVCDPAADSKYRLCGDVLPKEISIAGSIVTVDFCTDLTGEAAGFTVKWSLLNKGYETNRNRTKNCGAIPSKQLTRIVGGSNATPASWPWIVAIFKEPIGKSSFHVCGGSLIHRQWVLTAAHCFVNKAKFYVKLGAHERGKTHQLNEPNQQVFGVEKWYLYPGYDPSTLNGDIALIKLDTPALLNKNVQTICLPDNNTFLTDGAPMKIAGWGLTEEFNPRSGSRTLNEAAVAFIDSDTCRKLYGNELLSSMICAAMPEGGSDACQGDSGGPLMGQNGQDGLWYLHGTVSWSKWGSCGQPGVPGIYANVVMFVDWIELTVAQNLI